ncbi:hypothetical protein GCM10009687_43380 [Asanoa iriomotensis]|uniref:PIN like domain-containing protein n=1 Tax=Asanoa iriomotensis TaxID=234613 RepID=A0ABQ4BUN4_9ACTN|nr:hypothetical protein Air01nite_03400 [Asanoa iriomotensis]
MAITSGMVVLDANVLLDAYRFTPDSRADLLNAIRAVGERLWIPHQVALEFHKNRADVIASHGGSYKEAIEAISRFKADVEKELKPKVANFVKRVALPERAGESILGKVLDGLGAAIAQLEQLRDRHGIGADAMRRDPIYEQLEKLLDGKVGAPLADADEKAARTEAARRVKEKVPPGFGDVGKSDPAGDYLLWRQTLNEARDRQLPLLFVTRDTTKDDWVWRPSGRTLGALPDLVAEAKREAGVDFVLLTTQSFLHHARTSLKADVSEDTIQQAAELPPPSEDARQTRKPIQQTLRATLPTPDEEWARLIEAGRYFVDTSPITAIQLRELWEPAQQVADVEELNRLLLDLRQRLRARNLRQPPQPEDDPKA